MRLGYAFNVQVFDEKEQPTLNNEAAYQAADLATSLVREHSITPMSVNTSMVSVTSTTEKRRW